MTANRIIFTLLSALFLLSACGPSTTTPTATEEATVEPIAETTPAPAVTIELTLSEVEPAPVLTATMPNVTTTLPPACEGAPRSRLIVQERGRVTDNDERLNIRSGPGTDYRVLTRMEPSDIFFVLDGPTCAESYTWYRVRFRSLEGWIAEGDFDQYYAEPYLVG